ncbi:MAG TPA: hypothetical protein VKR06_47065 [Ktedonosporobacter sp.]|nr:hypothetical protein [Ktedonosporobacter sp.]
MDLALSLKSPTVYGNCEGVPELTALSDLARLHARPVLFYANGPLLPETANTLYECLRQLGKQEALDLVLQSAGQAGWRNMPPVSTGEGTLP